MEFIKILTMILNFVAIAAMFATCMDLIRERDNLREELANLMELMEMKEESK